MTFLTGKQSFTSRLTFKTPYIQKIRRVIYGQSNNKTAASKDVPLLAKQDVLPISKTCQQSVIANDWRIKMINRWKSLENPSQKNSSQFYLYVPQEEVAIFRQLVKQYRIQATVVSTPNHNIKNDILHANTT
ncbi:MAG: hypothetical protein AAGJ18_21925 [Bacteroidota bacterium]